MVVTASSSTSMVVIAVRRMVVAISLICVWSSSALAQQAGDIDLLNAEQSFEVARQAAETGDFQTAIIALERLLIISPGLANIQFELALLYKRVGATRRAEYLLKESLKSSKMPADIKLRAESELADISSEQRTGRFSYNAGIGIRSEDNPGSVPIQRDFFNQPSGTYETGTSLENPDVDGSLSANVGASYTRRFGTVAQHFWSTAASLSTSRYFDQTTLSSSDIRFDVSSTYALGSSTSAIEETASPFVYYELGYGEKKRDDSTLGLGVRLSKINPFWSLSFTSQASSTQPENSDTGSTNDFSAGLRFRFKGPKGSKFTYSLGGNFAKSNAPTDAASYNDASYRYTASYALEAIKNAPRSSVTLSLGLGLRDFVAPDLAVSDQARRDEKPSVGVSLRIPYSNGFSLSAGLSTAINRSNLSNYKYRNNSISAGVNWRF